MSSVDVVQELLSMSASAGAPTDTTFVDELREQIESLRAQLAEATEFVGRIQKRITEVSDVKSPEERIEQAVQFALRVVTTLSSIGPRLEKLANRFSVASSQLQELKQRTQRYRLGLTIGITLFTVWMAAGQAALCRLAWNGWRAMRRPVESQRLPTCASR
jgi:DNA repair exonuclease SbcCD ATPase subunit